MPTLMTNSKLHAQVESALSRPVALVGALRALCRRGLCLLLVAAPLGLYAAEPVETALPSDGILVEAPVPEPAGGSKAMGSRNSAGVMLGGYATLQLAVPRSTNNPSLPAFEFEGAGEHHGDRPDDAQFTRRARLNLSHLSAILWWEPAPAWQLLAEIDSQDLLQLPPHQMDGDDGTGSSANLSLERIYLDYRANDKINLRLGKFLTPIGRWNQEHPDPLTWTTLRPLISQSAFPTNATGLMLYGNLPLGPQGLDYQLFASPGTDWQPSPRLDPFERALGLRVATALSPELQIGASLAGFQQRNFDRQRFRLLGVDAVWRWHGAELSAEAIVRRGEGGAGSLGGGGSSSGGRPASEHGWFVQAVWPLAPRWSLVGRMEAYKRAQDAQENHSALAGIVYRSGRHWVLKAEWIGSSSPAQDLPQGLLSSLTFLF